MELQSPFKATLITIGRKSSQNHSVMLRGVNHNGKIYFSRHRPDSDWFKNAIANPKVEIVIDKEKFFGIAKIVEDEILSQKVSELKYPGEERAKEKRVAIEITLHG